MASEFDDEEEEPREPGVEPTPGNLAHWLEEQYTGDDRFESIEIVEPGPLEGEAVRVKFVVTPETCFFVGVMDEDSLVRVGLATADRETNDGIEAATKESGESLTDFMEDVMDVEDELEHEVQHFHDQLYYYCSDIPYESEDDLAADTLRDEVIYYLDGYITAFFDYLEGEV